MTAVKLSLSSTPITLQVVSEENLDVLLDLELMPQQDDYVATVAVSLAQAFVYAEAWPRAIMLDDLVVGFLMLSVNEDEANSLAPPKIGIWRLMIDKRFQGLGYGAAAIKLAIDFAGENGSDNITLSCVPSETGPQAFYEKLGFVATGEKDEDGEVILSIEVKPVMLQPLTS